MQASNSLVLVRAGRGNKRAWAAGVVGALALSAADASAQSYPLYCRGGGSGQTGFEQSALASSNIVQITCGFTAKYNRSITPGTIAEDIAFFDPDPGECRWKDRPFGSSDATNLVIDANFTNCNWIDDLDISFTMNNGTVTPTSPWGFTWTNEPGSSPPADDLHWTVGLTSDQSQFFTFSVHNDGQGNLVIDQFLCSGNCT